MSVSSIDLEFRDQIENSTDQHVEFVDEIAAGARFGRAVEFRRRQHGCVADLGRKHDEKRLFGCFFSMLDDEFSCLFVKQQIRLDEFVTRRHPTLVVIPSPFAARVGEVFAPMTSAGGDGNHPVFDVDVKGIRRWAIWRDERLVEAPVVGTVDQRCAFFVVDQQ